MKVSNEALKMIKHHEGVRLKPYKDCIGLWTVGVGHLIGDGKSLPPEWNRSFTIGEIDQILRQDLARFEKGVTRLCPVLLTQNQFDSLCSFAFNCGLGRLQSSTLRQKVLRGDMQGAAEEFLKYTRAGGKVFKGLVTRRNDERALFLKGLA
jgi:lysozyme